MLRLPSRFEEKLEQLSKISRGKGHTNTAQTAH